jgi:transglutaminase-like putative cysteine protease
VPNPAKDIIANRYGDCKDHALLAHLLFRACNIESRLVLVSTDDPVEPDLPSTGQFDHMIVHLPASGRFL